MADWIARLLDVKGAFLNGRFDNGEELFMEVPEVFERWYLRNVLLLLLSTRYGTKKAAKQYWKEMLCDFQWLGFGRCKADLCLYFKWVKGKLKIWLIWVDDCLSVITLEIWSSLLVA